ncbi:restriction endonuclease subunit S [Coprococcus comes]|uniref:restriction endonuclease subunit S n=1 Tax=Coprococcus comes TaxID=410072 RepID=UPI001D089F57|nr:restriction endonuclease subunit S [Coprococcus comes]MCB6470766.1 restriction endonuclease subunit S [Coprococcus comes]
MPYEKIGKNEPVCIADDVPFEIPDSWEWLRLGSIGDWGSGATPSRSVPEYYGGDIPWLKTGDLNDGHIEYIPEKISHLALEKTSVRLNPTGSVLIAMYGATIGKVGILTFPATTNQACCACLPIEIYNEYLFYFLMSQKVAFVKQGEGGAQPNISKAKIVATLMPLPPLAEQYRIVAKIKEVIPHIEYYGEIHSSVSSLNASFPNLLKKSILQEAVQGKLVPQDPTDEPASVLLEHIRAEKEQLIKAGKIKRDKNESIIFRRDNSHYEKLDGIERCIDDEIPFEIPESWAWTSVGEVCSNIQYGSSQKSSSIGKIAVLRMGNLQNGRIVLDKLVYTSDLKEIEKYPLEYNDLLFNRTNSKELVGKVAIYKGEIPAIYAGYLVRVHPILIESDYLNYVMQSQYYWIYCQNVRSDAIGQSNINAEKLKHFIFPLPPLQEQKRIVDRISRIFSRIEFL